MKTTAILAGALLLAAPATGMAATLGLDTENVIVTATGTLSVTEDGLGGLLMDGFDAVIQSATNIDVEPVNMIDFTSAISGSLANTDIFAFERIPAETGTGGDTIVDYAYGNSFDEVFGFTENTLEFVVALDIYSQNTDPADWLITLTLTGVDMGDGAFPALAAADYTANYVFSPVAQIAPVPLPAAGLMLLGGLGGLGGLAALRRKAVPQG